MNNTKGEIEIFFKIFDKNLRDYPELYNCIQVSRIYSNHEYQQVLEAIIEHKDDNISYKDSLYSYKKKDIVLIHYTSLRSLFSIISEKSIRFYNLDNTNDPNELKYAARIFKNSRLEIDTMLKSIFTFSTCEYNGKENLDIWRLYGTEGTGVGLILSIDSSNINKWKNFNLSKVFYGDEKIKYLKRLKEKIDMCNSELNKIIGRNILLSVFLPRLYSFHKKNYYQIENEVRICYSAFYSNTDNKHYPFTVTFDNIKFPIIKPDINKFNKKVYYIKLPLSNNEDYHNLLDYTPKIRIEGVKLGYRYNKKDLAVIKDVIEDLSKNSLGYSIEKIELTKLHKQIR